jgi:hypothetical protein
MTQRLPRAQAPPIDQKPARAAAFRCPANAQELVFQPSDTGLELKTAIFAVAQLPLAA